MLHGVMKSCMYPTRYEAPSWLHCIGSTIFYEPFIDEILFLIDFDVKSIRETFIAYRLIDAALMRIIDDYFLFRNQIPD